MSCLPTAPLAWGPLEHERDLVRFTVAYTARFADAEAQGLSPSSAGRVAIDAALVRDAPRGKVVGKLLRGADVSVVETKEGWHRIRFESEPREGWILGTSVTR